MEILEITPDGQETAALLDLSAAWEADYILLNEVSKNYRALLHLYIDELGMELWSARLFKPLGENRDRGII